MQENSELAAEGSMRREALLDFFFYIFSTVSDGVAAQGGEAVSFSNT